MGRDHGLIASVQPDGYLELLVPLTGKRHRCGPRGTTMWLALQRSDWQTEAAAEEIAVRLGVDPDSIRCDIEAWMSHFREAGE
ncbi:MULTISPECIES: hypothetical protein [unclassified Streptomyces]|uniref:hypothetical protein n=1 Tax=Streptomyces TaxID=1883 RepID=UPI0001C19473|nr:MULTISPECIES: hypothetical protein [unclassified Streptomyces]AEN13374.1 conserved hypothetical protein [Streptomyces sp. SirexAA-E]MYT67178.1 hypothetical protein [Streptomyces sp. SID8357]PZX34856.1 hypothetical protein K373_04841 [Streptomyces sp. DvalAA-21]SCE51578.1 hypothetical protein GA0115235_122511 [Streptomyces sp. DpondAA-F4a]HBF82659.1 hypothetical protein [Streptomyces sp.]